MGLDVVYGEGQTPLDEDEKEGLRIENITTHQELDEHEQLNIEKALQWALEQKLNSDRILTSDFIVRLHKRMLSDVWSWAGTFRKTEKNIGVDPFQIAPELRKLLEDVKYWVENNTEDPDRLCLRFKHRLVQIHCFANGNGRHSRIMADLMAESVFGMEVFSWNQSNMVRPDQIRRKYIVALREADKGNMEPLVEFARN